MKNKKYKLNKKLKTNSEAREWWAKNKDKVYDPEIEYPVLDSLPLIIESDNQEETLYSNKIVSEEHVYKRYYKDIIRDIYRWNKGEIKAPLLELKLLPYEMSLIEQRFIKDMPLQELADKNDLTLSYIYSVFSKVKKKVKEEYEKMLKYSGRS